LLVHAAMLAQAGARTLAQAFEVPVGTRHAYDRQVELLVLDQRLQRREDLLVGEIASGAEEDEGIGFDSHQNFSESRSSLIAKIERRPSMAALISKSSFAQHDSNPVWRAVVDQRNHGRGIFQRAA